MKSSQVSRWVFAGLFCGIVDFLWACVLSVLFYGSTFTRLWQGVAAVPLGPGAVNGGMRYVAAGLALHFLVAFSWSAIFVFVVSRIGAVRRTLATSLGPAKVAAIYGPLIWATMSLAVIPTMTHRMPPITMRWMIQLIGHFPFVGLPIVLAGAPRD